MQHLRTTALFSALAALFTVAYSRSGGRVYRPGEAEEDRKVITDPSARVEGERVRARIFFLLEKKITQATE